jgi:DNA-binding IclR family transcriptional regulator
MVDKAKGPSLERSTHQSLGRGLRILEVVAATGGGASLADVARRTELARSTTHYLMQALVTHGYLRQQPSGRNYQLGLKVFRLAGQPLTSEQIAATAMPVLNELCRLTHESVAIGIFRDDSVTLVATRDTDGPVRVVQLVGARRPVHCTALGKVLLAWLPAAEREHLVAGLQFEKFTPKSIVQRTDFERELRRVRTAGYAIDDEEFIVGVRCMAAPVFDEAGEVTMALSAIGPKQRMTHQRLRECRPLVLEGARKLGARPQSPDRAN